MANYRVDRFKRVLERSGRVGVEELILTFEGSNYVPLSVVKQTLEQLRVEVEGEGDGGWSTLGWALLSVYGHVVNHLLNQTLPISSGILYWDDVLDSGVFGLGVYGIQILPSWMWSRSRKWFCRGGSSGLGFNFNLQSIPFKRIEPKSLTEILYMANPAYVSLRKSIKTNKRELVKIRDDGARRLGMVVSGCLIDVEGDVDSLKRTVGKSIEILYKEIMDDELGGDTVVNVDFDASLTLSEYSTLAVTIIDNLSKDRERYSSVIATHGIPSAYVRYWPIASATVYGLYKVLGNWRAISNWAKTQLWETLVSFWQNRLVKPLYQIYETIRYDENEQVTLISKKSLESDINSLERMVIDLVTSTDKSISATELQSKVQQGDLTDVLVHYEKQIQSPIKSIVNGDLIRSLLIQIQKAKVDVEVAVNGIDKLLQSQQLVFGLIAALPAIGVTWWTTRALVNRTLEGNVQRRVKGLTNIKSEIYTCLFNIKRVLRKGLQQQQQQLTPLGLGLLLCQTHLLHNLTSRILTIPRHREFTHDLDEVETAPTIALKERALDRIYWRNYF